MELTGIFVLIAVFVFLLVVGMPISFSIGLATIATMLVTIQPLPSVTTVAQRMATGLDSFALLAIPFFILSGQMMNRGGIARRLIEFAKVLVGRLPGGLAMVNIIAAMLFGAISGSAVAAAAAIGGFMVPLMKKDGYDINYSAAVNITSSTTGLIIPPSNIMIVYSVASGGVSIAALFIAGYIPGILMGVGLMIVAGIIAKKKNYPVAPKISFKDAVIRFLDAIPSLLLIIIVIGGIIAGLFTPTEASAIAVLYTFILSVLIYREVKWKDIPAILVDTVATTAIVAILIGTSMAMSWIMSYENIPQTISASLIALTNNKILILLIINVVLLFVGMFIDMTPAVLIFTPIFLPVINLLGVNLIHFGIMMIMNLCIGLCTPPVGAVLFIGCGIAKTSVTNVVRYLIPLFIAMIIVLMIVTYVPAISLVLPKLFGY